MPIYALDDFHPTLADAVWVADTGVVVGRVTLGAQASVWFGATVRGDTEAIRIGARSNVQENAVLHADPGFPLEIGDGVTVGHQAMLHGCTIGDGALIGIQAIVLNGARIGAGCLVAAGAVVTEGKEMPPGMLVLGAPARAVRPLTETEQQHLRFSAGHYVARAAQFREGLRRID